MSKKGVLLVNLGSPKSPSTKDVRSYLKEFLGDPNVITMPRWLWNPILYGIILPFRSWRSATFYKNEWTAKGSPLVAFTEILAQQVQKELPDYQVEISMTYGSHHIIPTLQAMQKAGCEKVAVIPLFPNYTASTNATIEQQANDSGVLITIINNFYKEPLSSQIAADQIMKKWDAKKYDMLLLSYHGIPQARVDHGDPYYKECLETSKLIEQHLTTIPENQRQTVFQSKFGPAPWLKPYLRDRLNELANLGKRKILLATPSFVVDSLETIEEDNVQNYQTFRSQGGEVLDMVPPVNNDPRFSKMLANLAKKNLETKG
ncbi:ferrochelatase [Limosilactobacillus reuteri]